MNERQKEIKHEVVIDHLVRAGTRTTAVVICESYVAAREMMEEVKIELIRDWDQDIVVMPKQLMIKDSEGKRSIRFLRANMDIRRGTCGICITSLYIDRMGLSELHKHYEGSLNYLTSRMRTHEKGLNPKMVIL